MTDSMKYFEDFAVGDVIELDQRTVSREEILAYAREFDPAPPHLDDTAAREAFHVMREVLGPGQSPAEVLVPLDGMVASNWHVCAMFMRAFFDGLLVSSHSRGSPGIESLEWPNPVRTGDTIRFTLEVMEVKTSRSRPDLGFLLLDMLGVNQLGDPVMVARCWTMFGRQEGTANALV